MFSGTEAEIVTLEAVSVPVFATSTLYLITSPAFTSAPFVKSSFPTVALIFVSNFGPTPVVNFSCVDFTVSTTLVALSKYVT